MVLLMRKEILLTPGIHLTTMAYFIIANIFILRTLQPAKRSGSLILLRRDWDLTHEIKCYSAKDYRSSMKHKVWNMMEGCWIFPMVVAYGPLGIRVG